MATCRLNHANITGVVGSVPPTVRTFAEDSAGADANPANLERIRQSIGLHQRRIVRPGTTALDLCEAAARRLLDGLALASGEVDAIIFVTQNPDYFQPCNAAVLHGRMGFAKHCAAFDVNLGCSGYVYGLWLAGMMCETGGCRRVLLLAGDTVSRCTHPKDRAVAPLFGDGGSATMVERSAEASASWFSLHTDGSGSQALIMPAGAFRQPHSPEAARETTDATGNVRSALNLCMNGADVFTFSIREEPPAIREILAAAGVEISAIDSIVFHQANKYIIGNIAKRLSLPMEKAPCGTVEKYGNQSSASIPVTLCDALAAPLLARSMRLILSGFGVGLSWATALMDVGPLRACEMLEVSDA